MKEFLLLFFIAMQFLSGKWWVEAGEVENPMNLSLTKIQWGIQWQFSTNKTLLSNAGQLDQYKSTVKINFLWKFPNKVRLIYPKYRITDKYESPKNVVTNGRLSNLNYEHANVKKNWEKAIIAVI